MGPKRVILLLVISSILAAVAAAAAVGQNMMFKELHEKCRKEHQLTQDEFDLAMNKTLHLETDSQQVKCFVRCVLTGLDLMNADGEFTVDDVRPPLNKHKDKLPACKDVTGADLCEKAVNFRNCMGEKVSAAEKDSH